MNVSVPTVQKWNYPPADKRRSGAVVKALELLGARGVDTLIA